MDISVIEQIVNKLGIPITISIVFIWIVIDAYKFLKRQVSGTVLKWDKRLILLVDSTKETVLSLKYIGEGLEEIKSHLDKGLEEDGDGS